MMGSDTYFWLVFPQTKLVKLNHPNQPNQPNQQIYPINLFPLRLEPYALFLEYHWIHPRQLNQPIYYGYIGYLQQNKN
jgi:hypothetical protein